MKPLLLLFVFSCTALAQDGAALFQTRCASCHDAPTGRMPPTTALRGMNPMQVLGAMEGGVMKQQAEGLSSAERYAIMAHLVTPRASSEAPPSASAFCSAAAPAAQASPASAGSPWTHWGATPANTRFVTGSGLTAADLPRLHLRWAFGLGDVTLVRSQPAVADGVLYVGSQTGAVYALDSHTGCIRWEYQAEHGVRSAITVGSTASGAPPSSSAMSMAPCTHSPPPWGN